MSYEKLDYNVSEENPFIDSPECINENPFKDLPECNEEKQFTEDISQNNSKADQNQSSNQNHFPNEEEPFAQKASKITNSALLSISEAIGKPIIKFSQKINTKIISLIKI